MPRKRVTLVALVAGGHGGVPRYAQMLVRALGDLGGSSDAIEFSVLTTDRGADIIGPLPIEVRRIPLRSPRLNRGPIRVATEQLATRKAPGDLLHFFDLTGPLLASKHPFVATIHDVSVIHKYSVVRQSYKRWLYPWAARRARAVIAISEFAKGEAVKHLGADPSRVHVVHSGPGLVATAAPDAETPSDAAPYFLFVGNLTASKNLPFLVRAFAEADVDARLVLAGRPAEHFGELREAIEASPKRDRIDVLENVKDDDLDSLYRHAVALVLPSRYEGFALTPLEAMSRGCPVLASDIPAVREVSGDGAWLLPVDDNAGWEQALRTLLRDGEVREALKQRGAMRSAGFSWERTAQGVYGVFLDVLGVSA
jgi:glycosyltransferase involved in cell wall biosynthesis